MKITNWNSAERQKVFLLTKKEFKTKSRKRWNLWTAVAIPSSCVVTGTYIRKLFPVSARDKKKKRYE